MFCHQNFLYGGIFLAAPHGDLTGLSRNPGSWGTPERGRRLCLVSRVPSSALPRNLMLSPSPVFCFCYGQHFPFVFWICRSVVWSGQEIVALGTEAEGLSEGVILQHFWDKQVLLDCCWSWPTPVTYRKDRSSGVGDGDLSLNCKCLQYKQLSCSSGLPRGEKKSNIGIFGVGSSVDKSDALCPTSAYQLGFVSSAVVSWAGGRAAGRVRTISTETTWEL